MKRDVAIIGGGIVGTACAMILAEAGLSVTLIEKRFIGAGTTSSGMGHIVVMDDSEAQFALTDFSRSLWKDLSDQIPSSLELEKCGTIWIARDEVELAEAIEKREFYKRHKSRAEIIDSAKLYELEPNLAKGFVGGLLVKDDCVVYQLKAAEFFFECAARNGAELLEYTNVDRIEGCDVVFRVGSSFSAKHIINAAGIDAPRLSDELLIESRKGHLLITDRYPGFVSHQVVELGYLKSAHRSTDESVAFNVQPRKTGQILIGSSRQPGISNKDIDHAIVAKMLERAYEFMPGLKNINASRIWTGIRPATPDNLPYIGPGIVNKNVIIAAGHEGLGITTSLGTATLVADHVLARVPKIPFEPYLPGRVIV